MPHEFPKTVPIQLTEKGLFLLDLNDLVDTTGSTLTSETHQVSDVEKDSRAEAERNVTQRETPRKCSNETKVEVQDQIETHASDTQMTTHTLSTENKSVSLHPTMGNVSTRHAC